MNIKGMNFGQYDLKIFSHWGEITFQTYEINDYWYEIWLNE